MALRVRYDADADAVYIRMSEADILESEEVQPGVIVDLDADGKIVALEFLNATDRFSPEVIMSFRQAA
jgi:uncharacterized protein YuzE